MVAVYEGNNENLRTQIKELNHAYGLFLGPGVKKDSVKRKVINYVESLIIVVIQIATEGNNVNSDSKSNVDSDPDDLNYDQEWCFASRIEIFKMFESLERVRAEIELPRTRKQQKIIQELKEKISHPICSDEIVRDARAAAQWFYGSVTGSMAVATTGVFGAIGFGIGGPFAAGVSGGVTALFAFPAAVITTKNKVNQAERDAIENAEKAFRSGFRYT
jgi:hypothetical protein